MGLDDKADFGELQKLFDGTPGGYAWIAVKVKMSDHCLNHPRHLHLHSKLEASISNQYNMLILQGHANLVSLS